MKLNVQKLSAAVGKAVSVASKQSKSVKLAKKFAMVDSPKLLDKKASDAVSSQAKALITKKITPALSELDTKSIAEAEKAIAAVDGEKVVSPTIVKATSKKQPHYTSESIRQEALEQARGDRLLDFVTGVKSHKSAEESAEVIAKAGKTDFEKSADAIEAHMIKDWFEGMNKGLEAELKKMQAEKQAALKDSLLQKHGDKLIEKRKKEILEKGIM